jgi:hypothetical protein
MPTVHKLPASLYHPSATHRHYKKETNGRVRDKRKNENERVGTSKTDEIKPTLRE